MIQNEQIWERTTQGAFISDLKTIRLTVLKKSKISILTKIFTKNREFEILTWNEQIWEGTTQATCTSNLKAFRLTVLKKKSKISIMTKYDKNIQHKKREFESLALNEQVIVTLLWNKWKLLHSFNELAAIGWYSSAVLWNLPA